MSATSSFAVDLVRGLGAELDDAQTHLATNALQTQDQLQREQAENSFGALGIDLDLAQAQKLVDRKSLLAALDSLQASNTFISGQSTASSSSTVGCQQNDAEVLTRISILANALLLDNLIKEAELLGDQVWFWAEIQDERSAGFRYLVQTLPERLLNLVRDAVEIVFKNAQQLQKVPTEEGVKDTVKSLLDGRTLREVWTLIRTSPNFVVGSMFPDTVVQQKSEGVRSQAEEKKRPILQTSLLRAGAFSPLHLTKHEAKYKRKHLSKRRDELAEEIGRIALKLEKVRTVSRSQAGVNALITLPGPSGSNPVEHLRKLLVEEIPKHETGAIYQTSLRASPVGLGRPSYFARLWPSFIIVPATALIAIRLISKNKDAIKESLQNARETIKGFLIGWVYEPAVRLLDTVRHGEAGSAIIISRESLNSDLESLERMVTEFSRENYSLSDAELSAVALKVKEGDLTHVLKIYEEELKSPLKSAVKGSLVRALLIQIQKAKVDLEVAMSGIDSLLKSQQLLFGAVGIAPAMGILYITVTWLRGKLARAADRRGRAAGYDVKIRAWEAMRRIDELLAVVPGSSQESDGKATESEIAKQHGLLLLDLSLLRSAAEPLIAGAARVSRKRGVRKGLRAQFLRDVRQLESLHSSQHLETGGNVADVGLAWQSRRATLDRMWRSFGPLFALQAE